MPKLGVFNCFVLLCLGLGCCVLSAVAGAGTAGQFIFVNNTGGEALTFHNTEGTALFRGINANHDTMESNFMGMFVSDGTYWNLIAGGIDSQPDVGLTAS